MNGGSLGMAMRVDDVDLVRDRELVARHQAGDPTAFTDLYQRYFRRLSRFCRRQVGDAHVAEELAQEAFTRAFRALPRFAGERRFYPWMTVIARRLCVDHLRERSRVTAQSDPEVGVHDDVNRTIDARADEECLDEALDNVRRRHREVLRLRDWEDLSYAEIAARLDVPETTVPPLLHRARAALRREFLALVDPERLAAVPVLGLVVRFVQRKRIAVTSRAGSHGPEIGGFGASIAAAALSTMTVVAPGVLAHEPPDPAPQSAPVVVDASGPDEAGATDTAEAPAAGDSIPAPTETPPPPEDDHPDPVVVGPAEVDVGPEGVERTREEAEQQPVAGEVGPVFFGLNPDAVGEDVDRLSHHLEDLRGAL